MFRSLVTFALAAALLCAAAFASTGPGARDFDAGTGAQSVGMPAPSGKADGEETSLQVESPLEGTAIVDGLRGARAQANFPADSPSDFLVLLQSAILERPKRPPRGLAVSG